MELENMKEKIEANWQKILDILIKEQDVTQVAVHTWIEPLVIQSVTDSTITFYVSRVQEALNLSNTNIMTSSYPWPSSRSPDNSFEILFTDSPPFRTRKPQLKRNLPGKKILPFRQNT